jgi:hypothetical protein
MNVKSWYLTMYGALLSLQGAKYKALVSRGRLEYLDVRMRQRWEEA